ncbi:response regulator NasT [Shewanella sp. D64]|uniref:response regulator NasT n=1 Tax=unclassified Shewanella TaxID=196818 RepID=UPI0022BA4DF7|nr:MULTISPECIES: response regulator NasT [unclassified Shewanella]MEC4725760.1 response regulator NasT [Shewanella sp. D64]MEC4737633.1 response regulator NasT [Shewanella sp. E94]WBJ93445.1 response regulator NasT [Shewanella sp. MTB7]
MRLIVISEGSSVDSDALSSIFGGKTELIFINRLSEVERMNLNVSDDVLLLFTTSLSQRYLAFIDRLMRFSAVPLLVSAQNWQQEALKCLLACGRVTFVPGQLEMTRLKSVIELARLRFEGADMQLNKIISLENALRGQKQMAKVKAKLQAEGLTEAQAHKWLQTQTMKQGISLDQLIEQLA